MRWHALFSRLVDNHDTVIQETSAEAVVRFNICRDVSEWRLHDISGVVAEILLGRRWWLHVLTPGVHGAPSIVGQSEEFDLGCGTGLVGQFLQQAGFTTYDGTDISPDMMEHAGSRGYRKLIALDPGQPINVADSSYDVTLCVGVFTHGHLGPEGFEELQRITRSGGLICFTVNEGIWDAGGFSQAISTKVDRGQWEILEQTKQDYMVQEKVEAWYLTVRKTG